MTSPLGTIIRDTDTDTETRRKFRTRLDEGNLTRKDNATSHFCVYFAAYDPDRETVFIGLHRKSGLWLFNGGHMDPDESPTEAVGREMREEWGRTREQPILPRPGLLTLTEIEHPERQICEWHYDIWYFIPLDSSAFHPEKRCMETEYARWGWETYRDASGLFGDISSRVALEKIMSLTVKDHMTVPYEN